MDLIKRFLGTYIIISNYRIREKSGQTIVIFFANKRDFVFGRSVFNRKLIFGY